MSFSFSLFQKPNNSFPFVFPFSVAYLSAYGVSNVFFDTSFTFFTQKLKMEFSIASKTDGFSGKFSTNEKLSLNYVYCF